MTKRTLESLNERTWYRLLKVLVLGGFVFGYLLSIYFILYYGPTTIDENKTKIVCLAGSKKVFTADELNLDLSVNQFDGVFDYEQFYRGYNNENEIGEIIRACEFYEHEPLSDIFKAQAILEVRSRGIEDQHEETLEVARFFKALNEKFAKSEKADLLTFDPKLFDIQLYYTYSENAFKILFTTLVFVSVFEAIRRLFYYIVLGTFRTKKIR